MQDKCTPNPCKNNGVCRTSEDGKQAFCKCSTYRFKAPFCGEYSKTNQHGCKDSKLFCADIPSLIDWILLQVKT